MKHILILIHCLMLVGLVSAQSGNWKKQQKKADELKAIGRYIEAAEFYEKAWNQKSRPEFLYNMGECYLNARDYRKATFAFKQLTKQQDLFPLIKYYYAQSLQQNGEFEKAVKYYKEFNSEYQKGDRMKYVTLSDSAIKGCQLATDQQKETIATRIELRNPGENINSNASEFAPVLYADDILYYSTDMKGKVGILRSQKHTGVWSKSVEPNFPSMPDGHFCNGSFSPDGRRFYFTICKGDISWQSTQSSCDIYVTRLAGKSWTAPKKLRDYIKMDGTTATHPFVTYIGDMEYLYYVTDRIGGEGGLDIWYTSREVSSNDFDYTLPQNAGPIINTPGDEVTPFYDVASRSLYFSSNGHPNIGGYDVFKSEGMAESWNEAINLGSPFNSKEDDYYFVKAKDGASGFFVSNRLFANEKLKTTHDDIFSFSEAEEIPTIKGKLITKAKMDLKDTELSLYEIKSNGSKRLLQSKNIEGEEFVFGLIPNRRYQLEGVSGDYSGVIDFDTYNQKFDTSIKKDVELKRQKKIAFAGTSTTAPAPSKRNTRVLNKPSRSANSNTQTYTPPPARPSITNRGSSNRVSSAPPRRSVPTPQGEYYKIQFKTVVDFYQNDPIFSRVKGLGRLETEYLDGKGWTRVLLAEYYSTEEANEILTVVKSNGFRDAFIVRYVSGIRMTK